MTSIPKQKLPKLRRKLADKWMAEHMEREKEWLEQQKQSSNQLKASARQEKDLWAADRLLLKNRRRAKTAVSPQSCPSHLATRLSDANRRCRQRSGTATSRARRPPGCGGHRAA